ncbi:hypothetical protein DH2020_026484 [Rehmannia glutinosa]|uniref:Uncharacterized protein n=1 Tax=Rehmannia glutinosa TaxID=99300 RepID=A0ABR0VWX4_REHGL
MAMSRILSQSLHRASLRPPTALISHHRHRSNKTHHAQLVEVDLDSASSSHPDSPDAAAEVITVGIKKLEDAIHSIIVRRAAPDWLPFLPGYSYWVPPRAASMRNHSASNMIEVIGKLASTGAMRNRSLHHEMLSEDEQMSLTSAKGWPSSAVFIEELRVCKDCGIAFSLKEERLENAMYLWLDIKDMMDKKRFLSKGNIRIKRLETLSTSPIHPIPVTGGQVKIQDNEDSANDTSNSEDEEG